MRNTNNVLRTYRRNLIALIPALALVACAATPGKIKHTEPVPALDLVSGQALEGYDPVAYFNASAAERGKAEFSYQWQGAQWRFTSAANRAAFIAEPSRYAPQYGNYCAYAVSRGTTARGDPNHWAIVDGKLYVNNNRFAQQLWNENRPGIISAGDLNWPLLPKSSNSAANIDRPLP
jgi:YHS domain-containing protein